MMKRDWQAAVRTPGIVLLVISISLIPVSPCPAQTVTATSDLAFGDVFPGVPTTILKTYSDAAEFTVEGTADAEVTLDFDLPTYLYTTGANMLVFFDATYCAVDSSNPRDQSNPSANDLNPHVTITYRIGSTGLTVWLGGRIVPGLVQKSGDYTATIRLTVAYTGS